MRCDAAIGRIQSETESLRGTFITHKNRLNLLVGFSPQISLFSMQHVYKLLWNQRVLCECLWYRILRRSKSLFSYRLPSKEICSHYQRASSSMNEFNIVELEKQMGNYFILNNTTEVYVMAFTDVKSLSITGCFNGFSVDFNCIYFLEFTLMKEKRNEIFYSSYSEQGRDNSSIFTDNTSHFMSRTDTCYEGMYTKWQLFSSESVSSKKTFYKKVYYKKTLNLSSIESV